MRLVNLGDVCRVVSGATPKRANPAYWAGTIPWVTPKEIGKLDSPYLDDSLEKITELGFKLCSTEMLPVGSLLLSSRAPIGLLAINKKRVCTNQGFKSLVPSDQVKVEYLYYYLKANVAALQAKGNGATFKELSKASVEEFKIPLPPLDDQKRIAHLLGKVEGLIARRKHHLQQFDDLLKSVFLEMFGDPVRNEKGWHTSELEKLCEEVIDCPHSTPVYSDEKTGYYCVRSGDIVDGYLDLSKTLYVGREIYEERIKRYTPQIGDIVYSREGGRLGNAARILGEESICLGQRIMLFKTSKENSADFLWALFESRAFKAKLQGLVGGGAAPRVNIKDLKKITVINPPHNIQTQFSLIAKRIDDIKSRYQHSLTDLESLYGALSQKAFKGELDLSRVMLPDESTTEDTESTEGLNRQAQQRCKRNSEVAA